MFMYRWGFFNTRYILVYSVNLYAFFFNLVQLDSLKNNIIFLIRFEGEKTKMNIIAISLEKMVKENLRFLLQCLL